MKKCITILIVFVMCLSLCGCMANNNSKTISKINQTITKTQNVLSNIQIVANDKLYINEIMDENNNDGISQKGTGYNGATFTSSSNFDKYVSKLYSLKTTANTTVNVNKETENIIFEINTKINNIESISSLINKKNSKIEDSQISAINELCNSIAININKVNISKDEIKIEAANISKLKQNYTNNLDKLNGKYTKLTNSLQTRNQYLLNISNCFENIYENLAVNCCECNNCEVKQTAANIDTYNNQYKKEYKQNKKRQKQLLTNNYNSYNNPYNYGYIGTNPYYTMGGYGFMGNMGFGRYPFSPYSNYNPYMPNIDTFYIYKNIDTYKNPYYYEPEEAEQSNNNTEENV